MSDESTQLAALYPSMQGQEQQQSSAAPPRSDQQLAELLYGNTAQQKQPVQQPDLVQENALKELHVINELYGEQAYRDVNLFDPSENVNRPEAEVAEENAQHRDDLWALQVPETQAVELTTLLRASATNKPTEAQQLQQYNDAKAQLVARHGEQGARERLTLVQQFISRSPRLAKRIGESGLANHPRVFEVAHELAWSQRAKGLM